MTGTLCCIIPACLIPTRVSARHRPEQNETSSCPALLGGCIHCNRLQQPPIPMAESLQVGEHVSYAENPRSDSGTDIVRPVHMFCSLTTLSEFCLRPGLQHKTRMKNMRCLGILNTLGLLGIMSNGFQLFPFNPTVSYLWRPQGWI